MAKKKTNKNIPLPILILIYTVLLFAMYSSLLDCTGFAGHVEKTYNEVKGRVRNYEREQISQKV
jgi:hypothetical protein